MVSGQVFASSLRSLVLIVLLWTFIVGAQGCHENEFECKGSKVCISRRLQCDGRVDCDDFSDEAFCHKRTTRGNSEVCRREGESCQTFNGGDCCPCMSCSCRSGALGLHESCVCTMTAIDKFVNLFKHSC